LALSLVASLSLPVFAQAPQQRPQNPPLQTQPAAPPASIELDQKLTALLQRWEQETARLETMSAKLTCSRKNPVFNKVEVLEGHAKFMKLPDGTYGASLYLQNKNNPESYERYICTGRRVYVFRPHEKAINVYDLPPKQAGQLPDDGALPFLFGMKAQTARQRYDLRLSRENEWYTYVDALPRYPRDQNDFIYSRLTIMNREHPSVGVPRDMPRQIYWVEPNKVEVTWDITHVQRNVPGSVNRADFQKPDLPRGWTLKNETNTTSAPPVGQPRVIRQQGP
jgi:TIGR03009 family protein